MNNTFPDIATRQAAAKEANERGAALAQQERYLEAAAAFEEAFAHDPEMADAFSNLGAILRRIGDIEGAIAQYSEAIRIRPAFAAAHYNIGNAYALKGDRTSAAESYRNAIEYKPDYAEAWNNLGRLLNEGGRHREALEACFEGLRSSPDNPHLRNNAGNALQGLGRYEEAAREYGRAIELAPNMSEAYSNLGIALKEAGDIAPAIEAHRKAVRRAPNDIGTLNNYGTALQAAGDLANATAVFERALSLDPKSAMTNVNLGTALMERNEVDRAITVFENVIDTVVLGDETNEHALAYKNLGLALMLRGDLVKGAEQYAWRWHTREFVSRDLPSPQWTGEALSGERVFVAWEQGFGDAIQFARLAGCIEARGGQAVFEAPSPLVAMLANATGLSEVVPHGDPLPETDLHIPMFDLLSAFSANPADLPGEIPYIHADPEHIERWSDRIPNTGRPRIGLVWAGRPTHRNDRNRSISLEIFLPLLKLPDVDFYALQVGERTADIAAANLQNDLIDLSPRLTDFSETAAALENLDLLISVDTAIVHAAGALGRPAWVLLPFAPDWRWGLTGETTPWYPQHRLWRQTATGDWNGVIERLEQAFRVDILKQKPKRRKRKRPKRRRD